VNLTPSQKGSFLAGIGLWVLIWASIWKADDIAQAMRIQRWFNSGRCIRWIGRHKSTSLLGTELVNYGTHGRAEPFWFVHTDCLLANGSKIGPHERSDTSKGNGSSFSKSPCCV